MYKVIICGHFGENKNFYDGQTMKTRNLYEALCGKYERKYIGKIDTYNWKKHPIKLFVNIVKLSKNCKNMIILPAHNGIKIFVPIFSILKKFNKFNLFYVVIGGWLPSYLKNKPLIKANLKQYDKIYVETKKMKKDMEKMKFNNIDIMVNFKTIEPLKNEEVNYKFNKPYELCTFSRVMQEKGIEDVIEIVKEINKNEIKVILDIYGPVDKMYFERFNEIKKTFPTYIKYKGCIDSKKSIETIKKYYLLLFPTRFYTEGIPGTIIDAYFSGVPVIATKWENATDIIDNNKTGCLVNMYNKEQLKNKIIECLDEKKITLYKKNILKKADEYTINAAIKVLIKNFK